MSAKPTYALTQSAKIVCFGEVLLRLASQGPFLLFQEPALTPTFCGAEANVAAALAGFGHDTTLVTALPGNALGRAAYRAFVTEGVKVDAGFDPEARLGLYFLQPGAMSRPASVIYDRKGSAFSLADPSSYDWQSTLDGADWLVLSGITAALGDRARASMNRAIDVARSKSVRIAFDTNYRPALWAGREAEAAEVLLDYSRRANLIFAGRRAAGMMLGQEFDSSSQDEGFESAAQAMFAVSPQLEYVAATRREVHSSDRQDLTALIANRDAIAVSETLNLDHIVDRVGTGDAFAAGVLHAVFSGCALQHIASFALACSAWAHSVRGDILHASLADIAALQSGKGDIRR